MKIEIYYINCKNMLKIKQNCSKIKISLFLWINRTVEITRQQSDFIVMYLILIIFIRYD